MRLKALLLLVVLFPLSSRAEWVVPFDPLKDAREASYFEKQNQFILAGGVAAFIGTRQLDDHNRDVFAHQRRLGDLESAGNDFLGTGAPGLLIDGSLWFVGQRRQLPFHVHAAQAGLEALEATTIVGSILKVTVQRERPDHSDFYSFPSGHTYSIAATAMSLQEFYGWRVGVPAFLLTALTAASRWSADKHWLSDTVAGAALGVYFGHAFSQAHLKRIGLEGDSQSVSETVPERRHLGFSWHIYPLPVDGGGELLALISL